MHPGRQVDAGGLRTCFRFGQQPFHNIDLGPELRRSVLRSPACRDRTYAPILMPEELLEPGVRVRNLGGEQIVEGCKPNVDGFISEQGFRKLRQTFSKGGQCPDSFRAHAVRRMRQQWHERISKVHTPAGLQKPQRITNPAFLSAAQRADQHLDRPRVGDKVRDLRQVDFAPLDLLPELFDVTLPDQKDEHKRCSHQQHDHKSRAPQTDRQQRAGQKQHHHASNCTPQPVDENVHEHS